MAKHKRKVFYAVVSGAYSPAIFTSWSVVCSLTSGYPNNKFKGFQSINDAISYMEDEGFVNCEIIGKLSAAHEKLVKSEPYYYAVANGREIGVYECYLEGSEPQVTKHEHSCHKRFGSREEADKFIAELKEATSCVDGTAGEENSLADMMTRLRTSE